MQEVRRCGVGFLVEEGAVVGAWVAISPAPVQGETVSVLLVAIECPTR